jgi:hypothetical protein
MLQIYERAYVLEDARPERGTRTSTYIRSLEELAANSAYAALVCVGTAAVFVVAAATSGWALRLATALGLAATTHLGAVLLMVMRRLYMRTQDSLNRALTGSERRRPAASAGRSGLRAHSGATTGLRRLSRPEAEAVLTVIDEWTPSDSRKSRRLYAISSVEPLERFLSRALHPPSTGSSSCREEETMPRRNLMSEAGSQASATAESESAEAAHRAKTEASLVAIAAEEASRSHRFQAGIWSAVNYLLGIPATVLAALAGVVAAGESETGWTVGLAIAAAILTGLLTYLKPAQHVADHRKAYAAYDGLQASAALVRVAVPEKSVEAFERLVDEKKAVDEHAAHRPWFLDRILQGRTRGTNRANR